MDLWSLSLVLIGHQSILNVSSFFHIHIQWNFPILYHYIHLLSKFCPPITKFCFKALFKHLLTVEKQKQKFIQWHFLKEYSKMYLKSAPTWCKWGCGQFYVLQIIIGKSYCISSFRIVIFMYLHAFWSKQQT